MNRWDEIQGLARDIASNVHVDLVKRDAMAGDLIKLCGLMIDAVGKGIAIDGESFMNMGESDDADAAAHAQYMVGERMQSAAQTAVTEAVSADLDRYTRATPGDPCVCGHVPSVHDGKVCSGEHFNGEACKGGSCTGFERRHPDAAWTPKDHRPAALRGRRDVNVAVSSSVAVAACCYQVTCVVCRNGGKVGGCCYPLSGVCPHHH